MFSEELNKLIEAAFVDGVLTEKEREIIKKRASSEGVDIDELELILDAKIQLLSQKHITMHKQNSDKRKCPSCGAIVDSFVVVCPCCGNEIRENSANITIQQLFSKLEDENKRYSEHLAIVNKEKAKIKVKFGESTTDSSSDLQTAYCEACCSIIKNFPVPNDPEALLEFLALGISQIQQRKPLMPYLIASIIATIISAIVWFVSNDDGVGAFLIFFISNSFVWLCYLPKSGIEKEMSDAWKMKCKQILEKAKLAFYGNSTKMSILDSYEQKLK